MLRRGGFHSKPARRRFVAVVLVASASLAATVTPVAARAAEGKQDPQLAAAVVATKRAFQGTNRAVDPTPRAAVKGKHLVIVSAGQSSISSQVPVSAAVDAAKTIGWTTDVYDGKLTPALFPQLVRQAVAAGADAIMLVAIDCQAVKQPLEEARAKGIAVTAIGAFDCNDPQAGGAKRGLFNASMNLGSTAANLGAWVAAYGSQQANYMIADSKNAARILLVTDPEFTTLRYIDQGFRRTIARSNGSKIVDTLELASADFVNGQLVAKIQAELLRHPDVTWVRSPFTYATTLGVVPALGAKAGTIKVMGGEGYQPEIDLLRDGKVTAVNVVSAEWESWAAVDTLNSTFRHEKPVESGFGWIMTDADHNLPATGQPKPTYDYEAAYRKAWGVTG